MNTLGDEYPKALARARELEQQVSTKKPTTDHWLGFWLVFFGGVVLIITFPFWKVVGCVAAYGLIKAGKQTIEDANK